MKEEFTQPKCELAPSLKEAIKDYPAEAVPHLFMSGLIMDMEKRLTIMADVVLVLSWANQTANWIPPANISELFRGEEPAPRSNALPFQYTYYIYFIEKHLDQYARRFGPPTDQDMHRIYSNMARRPDGKRTDPLQQIIWRAASLMLAIYPLSGFQFEWLFRRLASHVSRDAVQPISRNYAKWVMANIHDDEPWKN